MKRIEEVMTKEQRQQFASRIEVLEKVKAIMLVPQLCMATTEQVAEYFGVPVETIYTNFRRNQKELEANGCEVLSPKQIEAQNFQNESSVQDTKNTKIFCIDNCVFQVNNRGTRFYTPRAILCMAMLLRDSDVAAEIRTQLLNLVEAAPAEIKVANIQAQEAAMVDFAKALMGGDPTNIAQSVSVMMKLKDHTIAQQAESIKLLNGEKMALENKAASLTNENSTLTKQKATLTRENGKLSETNNNLTQKNSQLQATNTKLTTENKALAASNKMMAEAQLTWDPRRTTNAIIRKIGSSVFGGKFSRAWLEFYRQLQYQQGISVAGRGGKKSDSSSLDMIRDDEWSKVMKVLASVAYYYSIDVVAATNEFVVAAYQLDRIETPEGTKYNEGICRTRKMTPDEMRRPVVKRSLIPARVAL